jgi:predicted esterase
MKPWFVLILLFLLISPLSAKSIYCDADTDCFYVPQKVIDAGKNVPALLYLSCTGAKQSDLDSIKFIGDSLGWILFSCHATRNHRDAMLNDQDIIKTYKKAIKQYLIDTNRVFIYGFSGQGVQAMLSMFLHPKLFRGIIAECAHTGALALAQWHTLQNNLAYSVTREKDWNLNHNYTLHQKFQEHGIRDTLVITPGEHSIGTAQDFYKAVKWLKKNTQ